MGSPYNGGSSSKLGRGKTVKVKQGSAKTAAKNRGTLDQKHTEQMRQFQQQTNLLPLKKQVLFKMKADLVRLYNVKSRSADIVMRRNLMSDQIRTLEAEIASIESEDAKLSYLSKAHPIVKDYYNSNCDDEEYQSAGKNSVLSYLRKEAPVTKKTGRRSRAALLDDYQGILDPRHKKAKVAHDTCHDEECPGERLSQQGRSTCNICGRTGPMELVGSKPNYKEPIQESNAYSYKRINHLTEILSQIQAKELTKIPKSIYKEIYAELRKRKIKQSSLDMFRLRRIMKRLKNARKYHEHVPHILHIINVKQPPNFSRQDENRIKRRFKEIQEPFDIFCPKNRKNFLNYSYVIRKCCELINRSEYCHYFPLLKNNNKLRIHDSIWKKICQYNGWPFYKSV